MTPAVRALGKLGRARAAGLIVALAALIVAWGGAARADPPIWRIHGAHSEITLFGSVHLLSDQAQWRTPALSAALAQADEVWFEIPLDPESRAGGEAAIQAAGVLPQGKRLSDLLPRRARARLARTAKALNLPPQGLERLQPWLAETMLTLLDLQRHGAREGLGVEEQVSRDAPAGAERHAFETAEQQVHMLSSAPLREQVASLDETLRQIEQEPDSFERLQTAWGQGNVAWIRREALDPLRRTAPGLYRRMVADRNRRFAERIERLLQGSEKAFIVVGVGHLVGPDSVPALLRRKGVAVEGP